MNIWQGTTLNDTDSYILDMLEINPSVQKSINIIVEPPQNEMTRIELFERRMENYSGYELETIETEGTISKGIHDSLLARSLVENEGLWRKLAGK